MKQILLNTPMVQALLNTKPDVWPAEPIDPNKPFKWQTRRVIKPQPKYELRWHNNNWYEYSENPLADPICQSPWGTGRVSKYAIGDILYVRETWRNGCAADEIPYEYRADYIDSKNFFKKWKPSINMPREAARTFIEVKNIRAECLQDISEEDAEAEGVWPHRCSGCGTCGGSDCYNPIPEFRELWDSVFFDACYNWSGNPYVFVYDFMRGKKNATE